jgi:Cu-Zn family superoxide dismutase
MKSKSILACVTALAAGTALADYKVEVNRIDQKGVGESIGTVTISEAQGGGVTFTPDLKGLPPGAHGFHLHQYANCGPKEKGGKLEPGEAAGPHFDPDKAGKHAGPTGAGHRGDLPVLTVGADGDAKQAVTAKRLKMADLRRSKALVIHQGGDTYSEPPPSGGGGTRIACGLILAAEKK